MAFMCSDIGRKLLAFQPLRLGVLSKHLSGSRCCSSTSGNHGEKEQSKPSTGDKREHKKQAARVKLDDLLTSIKKVTAPGETTPSDFGGVSDRLARPGGKPEPRFVIRGARSTVSHAHTEQAIEQTKLKEPKKKSRRKKKKEQVALHSLDEEVARAAREVASTLGGDPAQTERDLLSKLTGAETTVDNADAEQKATSSQLSDLISGMRVTSQRRDPERRREDRAEVVRAQLGPERSAEIGLFRRSRGTRPGGARSTPVTVDLNRGPALDLFPPLKTTAESAEVAVPPAEGVWERVHQREMQLSVTHPPANGWEQMVLWTEQGKLWTLPVDNEAGLEEEASIGFHEHVFLEEHIESWCPQQGPVRHFMEIVCVALGKNPWLSLAEKQEHLAWFKEYFESKRELLQELKVM